MTPPPAVQIDRRRTLRGGERDFLGRRHAAQYEAGASLRELSAQTGRSLAWCRAILLERGVVLRPRGRRRGTA